MKSLYDYLIESMVSEAEWRDFFNDDDFLKLFYKYNLNGEVVDGDWDWTSFSMEQFKNNRIWKNYASSWSDELPGDKYLHRYFKIILTDDDHTKLFENLSKMIKKECNVDLLKYSNDSSKIWYTPYNLSLKKMEKKRSHNDCCVMYFNDAILFISKINNWLSLDALSEATQIEVLMDVYYPDNH